MSSFVKVEDTVKLLNLLDDIYEQLAAANRLGAIRLRWEIFHSVEQTIQALNKWEEKLNG